MIIPTFLSMNSLHIHIISVFLPLVPSDNCLSHSRRLRGSISIFPLKARKGFQECKIPLIDIKQRILECSGSAPDPQDQLERERVHPEDPRWDLLHCSSRPRRDLNYPRGVIGAAPVPVPSQIHGFLIFLIPTSAFPAGHTGRREHPAIKAREQRKNTKIAKSDQEIEIKNKKGWIFSMNYMDKKGFWESKSTSGKGWKLPEMFGVGADAWDE